MCYKNGAFTRTLRRHFVNKLRTGFIPVLQFCTKAIYHLKITACYSYAPIIKSLSFETRTKCAKPSIKPALKKATVNSRSGTTK